MVLGDAYLIVFYIWSKGRLDFILKLSTMAIFLMQVAHYYADHLYNRSPQWLGGGRPIVLKRYDPSATAKIAPDDQARCEPASEESVLHCREVFLVYSQDKNIFLAVRESSEKCPSQESNLAELTLDHLAGRQLCFVRLSAESSAPLRIPGPLPE